MQVNAGHIWKETQALSRKERLKLVERLIHQLRIEDEEQKDLFTWKEMYGMGKGVWNIEAQDYVNQLREDRS